MRDPVWFWVLVSWASYGVESFCGIALWLVFCSRHSLFSKGKVMIQSANKAVVGRRKQQ